MATGSARAGGGVAPALRDGLNTAAGRRLRGTLAMMGDAAEETDAPFDLAGMRGVYESAGLDAAAAGADPIEQFARWLSDAVTAGVTEPNAMTLSTADAAGRPAARTVLLKAVADDGFVFFSNYTSRKAAHLEQRPVCALLFAWLPLARQVAVRGTAVRLDPAASDAYFATRPRASQLAAWASPQSSVIADRETLLQRFDHAAARFPDTVPRPPHWGGYRVVPSEIEFWQGRADRLHDRLRYRRTPTAGWVVERLAP